MRFLIDHQLPVSLARMLSARGHDSCHVSEVGLDAVADRALWDWAIANDRAVISNDEDCTSPIGRATSAGWSGCALATVARTPC